MNRDCKGDYYQIGKTRFYRCFLDGSVMKASIVGATCPRCKRAVEATDLGRPQTRTVTTTEVFMPGLGWVAHEDPR